LDFAIGNAVHDDIGEEVAFRLQGLTPLYQTVLTPAGSIGYVGLFAQSTNAIPFVLNAR